MGLMVDTNVFIHFEKFGGEIELPAWLQTEPVYASVVTLSELLMGVHRANTAQRRQRRAEFVEAIIAGVGSLDFTLAAARVHAEIHSGLSKDGQMIGAHDLMIAATARHYDLPLLTDNLAEFSRVPGLRLIPFGV